MTVDLVQLITLIVGLIAIFGSIYSFSSKEKRIDLSIAAINSKLEMHEYRIHGCYEPLNHKATRLHDEIKALKQKIENLNE